MKKILLILAVITSIGAYAQKNSILLSGTTDYQFSNTGPGTPSNQSYSFNPTLGYQFSDHWTVGLNSGMRFYVGSSSLNTYSFGPFVRYSKKVSDMFSLFADINSTYMWNNVQSPGTSRGWNFGIKPLAFVNVTNNFGFTFSFGGLSYQNYGVSNAMESKFDANFGKTLEIGIQKNFGLK